MCNKERHTYSTTCQDDLHLPADKANFSPSYQLLSPCSHCCFQWLSFLFQHRLISHPPFNYSKLLRSAQTCYWFDLWKGQLARRYRTCVLQGRWLCSALDTHRFLSSPKILISIIPFTFTSYFFLQSPTGRYNRFTEMQDGQVMCA